jgi:predicted DNA-binding protein (MmcQ/YjbR family)
MDIDQTKAYCRLLPGVGEEEFAHPANILVFAVHGKRFAYCKTSEPERWRFSVRVTPERFVELTDQPGIKPARYMQRFHWVTIVDVGRMEAAYLRELIDWSYRRALSGLPKRLQTELTRGPGADARGASYPAE